MPRQVVVRTKECTEKVGRRPEGGPSPRRSTGCNPPGPHFTRNTKGGWLSREGRADWKVQGGGRKERTQRGKRVEEWKKLASGAQRAANGDNKRGDGPRSYYRSGRVSQFWWWSEDLGKERVWWLCRPLAVPVPVPVPVAWQAWRFLAGWLANPQGSCGGKSLAGSAGVAGVVRCCWRFQ